VKTNGKQRLPDRAPLDYAPDNEQGVIFLFSHLARKRFGLRIERVQAGFPDCIACRGEKRIRIEFEFRSSNFRDHRHRASGCDWLVCWIHDWPQVPGRLEIKELRKEYGLGFNVWVQSVTGEYREEISKIKKFGGHWSVPPHANDGDLLLYYRTAPDNYVRDIFRVTGKVEHVKAGWKPGFDYMAPIRRVCTLKAPLHFRELKANPHLKHAGFVRGCMQGRPRVTDYWPELHAMIVSRNPALKRVAERSRSRKSSIEWRKHFLWESKRGPGPR
jgi:hypothetical protein